MPRVLEKLADHIVAEFDTGIPGRGNCIQDSLRRASPFST
jgi:hypothetical protein